MKIKILYIKDAGNFEFERIIIEVLEDCDIGFYFVSQSKYTLKNNVSSLIKNAFWFPDKNVSKGDWIILYVKKGIKSEKQNDDSTKSHFYYWGLENAILNTDQDCIVVMEINSWKAKNRSLE